MALFTIKQGDTDPPLRAILQDALKKKALIQDADTVTFRMTPRVKGLRSDIDAEAHVNDGENGDVEYRWTAEDTAVWGLYKGEFHIAYLDGRTATFPTDGWIDVDIERRAGS